MAEEERKGEEAPEGEPEVYAVKKDLNGWQFDRRTFLAAAGAAAAMAAVGSASSCAPEKEIQHAFQTVMAEVTDTPPGAPKPTDVPRPTETPAPPPSQGQTATPAAPPTTTPTSLPPKAKFVQDVTIPDGTVMKPEQAFTKTWRFTNVGTVPWGEGVQLVFVEGTIRNYESRKMQGPDAVDLPDVVPGASVDVSVNLVAPKDLGHYRSYWRLKLGNGEWLENVHFADIFVASDSALVPGENGIEFEVKIEGQWVTWTQPCGSPIPPAAVCTCNCVTAPGGIGAVPAGRRGGTITLPSGETRWLPCGSPIPAGWTCTCNCVSVPALCTCDGDCACVGHTTCTCDAVHYWYPC